MAVLNLGRVVGHDGQDASAVVMQQWLGKFQFTQRDAAARATANVDIDTGGLLIIDGVQLAVGDMVLLTGQADKKENGLYAVLAGSCARWPGYTTTNGQAFDHRYIAVNSGVSNAGKIFTVKTETYSIGQDDVEFIESGFSTAALPGKIVLRDRTGTFAGSGGETGEPGQNINEIVEQIIHEHRGIGEYHYYAHELTDAELALKRLLRLEYQIIEIALYQQLCDLKWVGAGENDTADWWYRCDDDGTRNPSGLYMRVEDPRGLFFRNAGQNAVKKCANDTPYDGGDIGSFIADAFQIHYHVVAASYYSTGNKILPMASQNRGEDLNCDANWMRLPDGIPVRFANETRPASISGQVYMTY